MSSILNSSNLVFATAMAVSSTAVILAFLRYNKDDITTAPPPLSDGHTSRQPDAQILRPCLSSGGKKERKKKKVQFAENVKKTVREMEEYKKIKMKKNRNYCRNINNFGSEIQNQMPLNRVALYNGILRDRSNRNMGFSY